MKTISIKCFIYFDLFEIFCFSQLMLHPEEDLLSSHFSSSNVKKVFNCLYKLKSEHHIKKNKVKIKKISC